MYSAKYTLEYGEVREYLEKTGTMPKYKLRCGFQTVLGALGSAIFFDSVLHNPSYIPNYIFLAVCLVLAFAGWIKAYFEIDGMIKSNMPDRERLVQVDNDAVTVTDGGQSEKILLNKTAHYAEFDGIAVIYISLADRVVIPLRAFGEDAGEVKRIIENGCKVRLDMGDK